MNDGEAVEIRNLLRSHGERVVEAGLGWGARWDALEERVLEEVRQYQSLHPTGEIFGVELAGRPPFSAVTIDHHRYDDDDRWNAKSSLEQVAAILGAPLSRWQELVAANDRGYIPAMLAAGASAAEIEAVRQQDRAAQGITAEQEAQAERDVAQGAWHGELCHVECPDGCTSAHSDLLFGRAREILLTSPAKWSYFGPRHQELAETQFPERTWAGGAPESGYWGIESPGAGSARRVARLLGMLGEADVPKDPGESTDGKQDGAKDQPVDSGRTEPL
jgi:hypothetical protein